MQEGTHSSLLSFYCGDLTSSSPARSSSPCTNNVLQVVDAFKKTSCLIIKSPAVKEQDNAAFLDLVEKYFSQEAEHLMKDVRPELNYSVGATPEFTEIPRDHSQVNREGGMMVTEEVESDIHNNSIT